MFSTFASDSVSLAFWVSNFKAGSIQILFLTVKALANEDTLLRTHCYRHKCFPVCPHAQNLLRTQIFVSATNVFQFAQLKKHHGQQCVLIYHARAFSFELCWPNITTPFKALVNEDTLLLMMFLGLCKLGNMLRTENVSEQNQKHFLCPGHKICVRNKCCARGQTGKHLCREQCVRKNVSSFARALGAVTHKAILYSRHDD